MRDNGLNQVHPSAGVPAPHFAHVPLSDHQRSDKCGHSFWNGQAMRCRLLFLPGQLHMRSPRPSPVSEKIDNWLRRVGVGE